MPQIVRGRSSAHDKLGLESGRGAAWLARLLGVQEVPGSNPGGPTSLFNRIPAIFGEAENRL